MRELVAVARFGGRIYWRDRVAVSTSVALSLGLGIGLPVLFSKLGEDVPVLATHLGLLGMLVTLTALNQAAVSLSARRDQLILKRMRATGLRDRDILGGELVNITLQSTLVAVAISVVLYATGTVPPPAQPVVFLVFVVAGAGVLALLGAAFTAAISRAEIASVMAMPFFLLAGVGGGGFGPMLKLLPEWVQSAFGLLPSTALVRALTIAHEGGAWSGYLMPALNLAIWAVIGLAAIKLWFRWESRKS
ncbi:ABC transporter permease [Nonomuraea sp. NPDC050556]|uniref:ABC transporter permease n=1 Tax=Nonomuraea sp. NPDC050556 TaxID=3364369 RepID=UPI0037AB6EEA